MGRLTAICASFCGCGSPPAAELSFAAADPSDSCLTTESQWFSDLQRVWISAEDDAGPIAHACVETPDVGGWDALESKLRSKDTLLEDLPIGHAFHLYLLGVNLGDCPGAEGPATPFDFCAFTVEPVVIEQDADVHAELTRYCQDRIDKDGCYFFAQNRRE